MDGSIGFHAGDFAMRTGAVIVAAGMISRMRGLKPILSIGRASIAERGIAALQRPLIKRSI